MKQNKYIPLCLSVLASFFALPSCLERQFSESESAVSVNTREILVPSDAFEGKNLVKDTLYITANRNWSVEIEPEVDWVSVDTTGWQNLAQVSESHPLVFSFKDNETDEERSATLNIFCDGKKKQVKVRQEAISYRLVLTSSKDGFGAVKSDGDELPISFNTNTEWKASLMTGSDAKITFSSASGKYSSDIKAIVAENEDLVTKSAVIVISAKNCKDIEIPVGQLEGFPYFRIGEQQPSPYMKEGLEYEEGIDNCVVSIETNTSWTAEVVEVSGFDASAVKVTASGTKADKTPVLTFPYCTDFNVPEGKITVRFTASGVDEPVLFSLTQKPCIRLRWWDETTGRMVAAEDPSQYPFSSPLLTFFPTSKGNASKDYLNRASELDLVLTNGYAFTAASTLSFWRNGSTALMFGGGEGDYLKLPAVEGKRLSKIHFRWGGKNDANIGVSGPSFKFSLKDSDGNKVPEATYGEDVLISSPERRAVTVDLEFPGTQAGVSYKIYNEGTASYCVGNLTLYYE